MEEPDFGSSNSNNSSSGVRARQAEQANKNNKKLAALSLVQRSFCPTRPGTYLAGEVVTSPT